MIIPLNNSMTCDILIIGGGIIGLNIACELKSRYSDTRVVLIEKEDACGLHASGRNSGVLHAGFYYTADSLKAKFTKQGNEMLTAYCLEKKLAINRCGKIVVARDEGELEGLEELLQRARKNEVDLEEVTDSEARKIEPRVKTFEKALFSPTTSSVDPAEVMRSLVADAEQAGVELFFSTRYLNNKNGSVNTTRGSISTGYVVNAAGLYADKIARDYDFSSDYKILPFKGLYLYSSEKKGSLKTNIYPVPDLKNPFLGVHYTVTVDGEAKIGPTAVPAFWREQYDWLDNFNFSEFLDVTTTEISMMIKSGFNFRELAFNEIKKYYRPYMVKQASHLLEGVEGHHYKTWGKPGIRAQLLDVRERKLVMDFRCEGDARSFHILNAVSPAFTCSIPFSRYVCDRIDELV